mmetsp:Transcript_107661/g.314783  ORF Transcript_107661/g.314783 Transcript_107661/m.314783 type:complete len:324 (+) Transcript_107661:304-1275(+)
MHEVEGNALRHHRVILVFWMLSHKSAHPGRGRQQLSRGSLGDEVKVRPQVPVGDRVAANVFQVGKAERHQARKVGALAVDDLVHRHLLIGVAQGCGRARVPLADFLRDDVLPEPELAAVHRVHRVGAPHVVVNLGEGHEQVQVKDQQGPGDEHYEGSECRVLKIGELHLHGPELGAPTDMRATHHLRWWWLPSHCLPVRGINALKVVHRLLVIDLLNIARKGHKRITHEEMRQVVCQGCINPLVHQCPLGVLVNLAGHIVVVFWRGCRLLNVAGDGVVPTLAHRLNAPTNHVRVRGHLLPRPPLRWRAVVHGGRDGVPAHVHA